MSNNTVKAAVTAVTGFLSSVLGVLYIPVLLMVACNIIDYITGLLAAPNRHRNQFLQKHGLHCKKGHYVAPGGCGGNH